MNLLCFVFNLLGGNVPQKSIFCFCESKIVEINFIAFANFRLNESLSLKVKHQQKSWRPIKKLVQFWFLAFKYKTEFFTSTTSAFWGFHWCWVGYRWTTTSHHERTTRNYEKLGKIRFFHHKYVRISILLYLAYLVLEDGVHLVRVTTVHVFAAQLQRKNVKSIEFICSALFWMLWIFFLSQAKREYTKSTTCNYYYTNK